MFVTLCSSMRSKHVSGSGVGAITRVPPQWNVPNTPGAERGKLCAIGRETKYTVVSSKLLARTLYRTQQRYSQCTRAINFGMFVVPPESKKQNRLSAVT